MSPSDEVDYEVVRAREGSLNGGKIIDQIMEEEAKQQSNNGSSTASISLTDLINDPIDGISDRLEQLDTQEISTRDLHVSIHSTTVGSSSPTPPIPITGAPLTISPTDLVDQIHSAPTSASSSLVPPPLFPRATSPAAVPLTASARQGMRSSSGLRTGVRGGSTTGELKIPPSIQAKMAAVSRSSTNLSLSLIRSSSSYHVKAITDAMSLLDKLDGLSVIIIFFHRLHRFNQ